MIPFILILTFSILLALVFVIPGLFLFVRCTSMLSLNKFNTGDMKVPTFYSTNQSGDAHIYFMSIVGIIFGGIHCVGWFFNFPSWKEAMLWRISSSILTGVALLLPLFSTFFCYLWNRNTSSSKSYLKRYIVIVFTILFVVYLVSRLLLLVEAFISLRDLTPGMLALVKWTSFIAHF